MEKNYNQIWSKIVAKAWSNANFKERLTKHPREVLREEGIEFPEATQLTICENTDTQLYIVLPKKPEGQWTEQQLESVSGGENLCGDKCGFPCANRCGFPCGE